VSGARETPGRTHGSGANINPPNRFERISVAPRGPDDAIEPGETIDLVDPADERRVQTIFFRDASRSVLSRNDSPDIPI
jgi:hypothetical protein